ncbi:MAG: hypothetical protein HF982_06535 [Desulfobacteraceae bacterium]|nr:hypothetical protein [Desulfobacteraceae bacterium]MBC2719231.1 hypothetical protein [Desulfobacteraceae bacterium]
MKSKTIGYRLMEAMTKDQIAHMLDAIFDLWGSRKIDDLLQKLNKDVANHKNIEIACYSINFCDLKSNKSDPNLCAYLWKLIRPRSLPKKVVTYRPDNWKGNEIKELVIKRKLYEVLGDEKEVERIFPIVKQQSEY